MFQKKILVWFRNDLRLHDNEVLIEAIQKADQILPVYFFDPRQFSRTSFGTLKTGITRANFLIQSVRDLRHSFQQLGGNILICFGEPELLLPKLVEEYEITEVYHHREVAVEETYVSSLAEDALWKLQVNLKHFIGHTLYNKEDLPFPIKDIPDSFAKFKKKTEREATVKECFETPISVNFVEIPVPGELPDLASLFGDFLDVDAYSTNPFKGGELEGLAQLSKLLISAQEDPKATIANFSSLSLSPWLSLGCLSPRRVFSEIAELNKSKDYLLVYNKVVQGLLWRDYFRFMFKKHGNNFFKVSGFSNEPSYTIVQNSDLFENWKNGCTGQQEVDFVMQSLNSSGYIDTMSRNLALTYLIEILQLDWTFGAAYFEEVLVDYAPASNWGNWAIYAGVGNDSSLKPLPDFDTQLKNFNKFHLKSSEVA